MLLHCSKCNSSCHPTCVGLSLDLISYVTSYEWECTDCKQCMKCQASHFMRIEPRLSWFYNYISFALCNFPISRILLMRTRCSSATSVTEDITSTALDSKQSQAVDTASYTTYYIMHILETTSFVRPLALFGVQLLSKLWMQDAFGRRQCCPGQVETIQVAHCLSLSLSYSISWTG